MALYLVQRTTPTQYDQYSSMVVSASDPADAIEIAIEQLGEEYDWGDYEPEEEYKRESLASLKEEEMEYRRGFREATVTLLNEETERGVVLASYQAG